jgi:hypothetical protein
MDWTKILADAGIPEPPGYIETVAAIRQDQSRRFYARQAELEEQEEERRQRLAAQGGKRKAVRSKVRVGA